MNNAVMSKKRIVFLKMTVDWEDYDDVCDELLLEDTGILDNLKEGIKVEHIKFDPNQLVIPFVKDASPEDYAQIKFNDNLDD
jgi:hypothetical protein